MSEVLGGDFIERTDRYLNNDLTEEEEIKLWKECLEEDAKFEYMTTVYDVKSLNERNKTLIKLLEKSEEKKQRKRRLFLIIAAIISTIITLLVI